MGACTAGRLIGGRPSESAAAAKPAALVDDGGTRCTIRGARRISMHGTTTSHSGCVEVPGYKRAGAASWWIRRPRAFTPPTSVAMWRFTTSKVSDRQTIIDMLMARRRWNDHRSTDLLDVTERVLLPRIAPTTSARNARGAEQETYTSTVDCLRGCAAGSGASTGGTQDPFTQAKAGGHAARDALPALSCAHARGQAASIPDVF